MINVKTETQVLTQLTLSQEEVKWLRSLMQNPMWVDNPADESAEDKCNRLKFWAALGGR